MSKSDSELTDDNVDFGSVLAKSRKTKNYTVEDISKYLKIPADVIEAIESSNIEALPVATFTQGYIRAYAKFLEISEESVLDIYNRAVPHGATSDLRMRSALLDEANSQSPVFKTMTLLLMVAGVAALIYGGFQYYQEKVDDIGVELESKQPVFTGNSLDSPGSNKLIIKQDARLTDDDELLVTPVLSSESIVDEGIEETLPSDEAKLTRDEPSSETMQPVEPQQPVSRDVLEIYAKNGSWMQVRDATDARLFYNMIPVRGSKRLEGVAPFRVSFGNADSTQLVLNGVDVGVAEKIRPNNTAIFTVSTKEQTIVFH